MSIPEPTDREKIRALPWSLTHSTLTNVFYLWTFGGSVFPLFLSEVGLEKSQIGIMLSLFPFSGLVALVFAPTAARLGWKRVFIICYGARYPVIALLLGLPWLMNQAGNFMGVIFLFGVFIPFAMLRALGETAYYPWSQEFVPNAVRGKYAAMNTVLATLVSAVAMLVAGTIIGASTGLGRFLLLLGIGVCLGAAGILVMVKVPGGAPRQVSEPRSAHRAAMISALRDRNFTAYLGGMGGVTLGAFFLTSFLPLYLKEQIGLPPGTVVTLDTAMLVGGGVSSLLFGWAADRVGSRPVLMPALTLCLLMPVGWLVLPRGITDPSAWCAALYFIYGVAASGISIAGTRLLFNGVISPEKSTAYTALYYAWMGITGGSAPLLAGWMLSTLGGWQAQLGTIQVDGYRLLFMLSLVVMAIGWWAYYRVKPDAGYTTRSALKRLIARLRGR